ncbi:MAG: ABC transporter substrate-binding protein [Halothece sp.]
MLGRLTLSIFFLGLFTLTACNNQTVDRPIPDPGRTITHARGETVVPQNPDRVIALDNIALDSVLALEVEPIAALINENTGDFPVHLRDQITERTQKLSPNQQNLERITQLDPDLIIGGKNVEAVYNQLNQIAPTVLLGESGTSAWKEKLLLTAEAVGKPEKGEALLKEYQQRADDLASRLENPEEIEVSVVRVLPNGLRLYQNDTFVGGILKDVGLSRPASQDEDDLWMQISRERMELADGDVIFVWSLGEEAETTQKRLEEDPLWKKLDAVQAGNVYQVPGYWIGRGPIAANKVLADLEKNLSLSPSTSSHPSHQDIAI